MLKFLLSGHLQVSGVSLRSSLVEGIVCIFLMDSFQIPREKDNTAVGIAWEKKFQL